MERTSSRSVTIAGAPRGAPTAPGSGEKREPTEAQGGVVQHGVGRARRGPGRVEVGGDGPYPPRIEAGNLQHGPGELEPRHRALVRDVEDAGPAFDGQPADRRRQVVGEAGLAAGRRRTQASRARRRAQDRLHHVAPVQPAHPRRAHDRGATAVDLPLAAELGPSVHRDRARRVPLDVRPGLVPSNT